MSEYFDKDNSPTEEETLITPEVQMLLNCKHDGYYYRERRHNDWEENYTLYRDKIITNRLTQRQSVNLPIMKNAIRTLLKDVDDMPVLYFENLDNDKQAEVFENEYWDYTSEINNMELKDIVDKRQCFIFGRTFDQWQVVDGKIKQSIQDPQDILVQRYVDPTDLDSSRFLIHQHVFVPLNSLKLNPDYDQEQVEKLQKYYASQNGLIKAEDNVSSLSERNERMSDMGLDDVDSPILGETYVELTLYFIYRNEDSEGNETDYEQIFLYVVAEDMVLLLKKPLEDVIGKTKDNFWRNHYPYTSWADDMEQQDFWSDGIADVIRNPNKVANVWYSQEVERRTLSNFGMHYYDSSVEGFNPNTFNPMPWGWYPVPVGEGKRLADVFQKVTIPANDGNLESINFLMGIADRASGAGTTQQGAINEKRVTLGEIELALAEAKDRVKGMSKFYTHAWKRRGLLFIKLIEAASDKLDAVKIFKKGRNTNEIFSREIKPSDWMTESGSQVKVWSMEEKNTLDTNALQKATYIKNIMPGNPKVQEIYQRKSLEFAGYTPEEINDIMEFERQKQEMIQSQMSGGGMMGMQSQDPTAAQGMAGMPGLDQQQTTGQLQQPLA